MKRFTSLLLSLLLMLSMGTSALATTTATASVLRLETITGDVTITNAAGRTLTAREDMRLLNGYTISTSSSSYAYVSLDDTKAVKLDALTTCTIRQQNSKLELLVETGNIFFNVSAPLSSSETMNIRTSTLATGIRGTSGTVWSDGENQSGVRLHTGSASVTTINPSAIGAEGYVDDVSTAIISVGQEAVSTRDVSTSTTDLEIITTGLDDYSGFELEAISNEDGLLDEILQNEDSPLTAEVFAETQARLEAEQALQEALSDNVSETQADLTSSDSTKAAIKTPSSSSSGSSSNKDDDDDDVVVVPPIVTTATVYSATGLTDALLDDDITEITVSGVIELTDTITINKGVTVKIGDGAGLASSDEILNYGTIYLDGGDITVSDLGVFIYPSGRLDFISGTIAANNYYAISNAGTVNMSGGTASSGDGAYYCIYNAGTFNMDGGDIIATDATAIYNASSGEFNMSGGTITSDITNETTSVNYYAIINENGTLNFGSELDYDDSSENPTVRAQKAEVISDNLEDMVASFSEIQEDKYYYLMSYDEVDTSVDDNTDDSVLDELETNSIDTLIPDKDESDEDSDCDVELEIDDNTDDDESDEI